MPTPSTDLTFQPLLLESCPQIARVLDETRPVFDSIQSLEGIEIDFIYRDGLFEALPEHARLFCAKSDRPEDTKIGGREDIDPCHHQQLASLLEDLSNEPAICDRIGEINQKRPVGADPHDFVVAIFRHCIVLRHADPIGLIHKMRTDLCDFPLDPYVRGRLLTFGLPAVSSHHQVLKHATGVLEDIKRYQAAYRDLRTVLNTDLHVHLEVPSAAELSSLMSASRKA